MIFLDLDGVIINFAQGVIDYLHLDMCEKDVTHWDSLVIKSGLTKTVFWSKLDEQFWLGLKKYDWADDLIAIFPDAVLLTSPAFNSAGYRQEWIREHLPQFFYSNRYIIAPDKKYCAKSGALLIDDNIDNCESFEKSGGDVIIFPQIWNGYFGNENLKDFKRRLNGHTNKD